MTVDHANPAAQTTSTRGALIALTILVALTIIAALAIGADITPALTWPTTYAPGPGGDPTYLPPAR